jgi:hypothetical protein
MAGQTSGYSRRRLAKSGAIALTAQETTMLAMRRPSTRCTAGRVAARRVAVTVAMVLTAAPAAACAAVGARAVVTAPVRAESSAERSSNRFKRGTEAIEGTADNDGNAINPRK